MMQVRRVLNPGGHVRVPHRVAGLGSALAAAVLALTGGSPAQAQDAVGEARAVPGGAVAAVCVVQPFAPSAGAEVVERSDVSSQGGMLLAYCGGAGVVLGEMDRYRSFAHQGTGAVVVEIEYQGRRRVMLLERDADGQLVVENIEGALAVAAGRTPTGGLRAVATDYARFARDGVIAVADEAGGDAARPGALSQRALSQRAFDLSDHNRGRQALALAAGAAVTEGER